MPYIGINTGTTPNDGTGDSLLTGAVKINSNFEEIYSALGDGSSLYVDISNSGNLVIPSLDVTENINFNSVSEKISIVSGNTANISFNSGGGNIIYFSNPTGPINLNVNGIPTSNFDNRTLTFSVIVNQSTVSYACSSIILNGVFKPIKWQLGNVPLGNTSCIDVFNFIGINTIGSGSSTSNYLVFANLNGDYK